VNPFRLFDFIYNELYHQSGLFDYNSSIFILRPRRRDNRGTLGKALAAPAQSK
jgi:hypothetical protein